MFVKQTKILNVSIVIKCRDTNYIYLIIGVYRGLLE